MKESEDLEFIDRCLKGEHGAFERLVAKYQNPIYNVALRMVHDTADAEDVAQTAFVKAFEKLGSFDRKYKFFSWLYRIAVNEALSFLSHRNRFDRLQEETAGEEDNQQTRSEEEERDSTIQKALKELKADHRSIVVLRHFEGLSYEEIGEILNISPKKVKSRLFAARMVLRQILVRKGVSEND